jgi:NTP pyrophosphatase (non-canonical NTP hydrolase)
MKTLLDTRNLEQELQKFADARDWNRFHSPKNLVMALTGEVGELVELFQWLSEEQSSRIMTDAKTAEAVRHEIADVMLYLVRLAGSLDVDLNAAVNEKLALNAMKYPPNA